MLTSTGESNEDKLLYKGAEAEIYLQTWLGEPAIRKTRKPKPYRIPELDDSIRRTRTVHEATMMHEARKLGVPVPIIRHVDASLSTIIMEYLSGPTLKAELDQLRRRDCDSRCHELGEVLGVMHDGGIVHGDLTISNVICQEGKVFLIDFGLGGLSNELEDRGVDLLLLSRAIKSTHYAMYPRLFQSITGGYSETLGLKASREAMRKMHEIERRGRYFERT